MSNWLGLSALIRCLRPGLVALNKIGNELDLPELVRINALKLYKHCIAKKLTQGRKRELIVSACLLISSQGHNYPLDVKSLCKACDCTRHELFKTKRFIKRFIKVSEGFVYQGCNFFL